MQRYLLVWGLPRLAAAIFAVLCGKTRYNAMARCICVILRS
jgi:hypothetical protein